MREAIQDNILESVVYGHGNVPVNENYPICSGIVRTVACCVADNRLLASSPQLNAKTSLDSAPFSVAL
jgi:hypothetical protein